MHQIFFVGVFQHFSNDFHFFVFSICSETHCPTLVRKHAKHTEIATLAYECLQFLWIVLSWYRFYYIWNNAEVICNQAHQSII